MESVSGRFHSFLNLLLIAVAALVAVSVVFLAVVHFDDMYRLQGIERIRLTLARFANMGQLYPPLEEDGYYGGTRYMPLPIVLHASAARVSGEYIMSGKAVTYLFAAILAAFVFGTLRKKGCSMPMSAALTAAVFVTPVGLTAALGVNGDIMPLVLQLVAISLIADSTERKPAVVAGVLCAVALLSKLPALWGPAAIAIWLWRRGRSSLPAFLGSFLGAALFGWLSFYLVTDGRITQNVAALAFSGISEASDPFRPLGVFRWISVHVSIVMTLAPVLALAVWTAVARKQVSIYLAALGCYAVLVIGIWFDPGVDINHLADLTPLVVIVMGELWVSVSSVHGRRSFAAATLALVVGWGIVLVHFDRLQPEVETAYAMAFDGQTNPALARLPLEDEVPDEAVILSEDPYVPASRGHRPVVLDPWIFLRLSRDHPEWATDLARRIEGREFNVVVLRTPLQLEFWFEDFHFGPEVLAALKSNYEFEAEADGYYLYVPAE